MFSNKKLPVVKNLDWTKLGSRGGIIPFMQSSSGHTVYGVSLGASIGSMNDLAGGYEVFDQDLLNTCIREFEEESFCIFGQISRAVLQDCQVLVRERTVAILYPIPNPLSIDMYIAKVRELTRLNSSFETQNILFFSAEQLLMMAENQRIRVDDTKPFLMCRHLRELIVEYFPQLRDAGGPNSPAISKSRRTLLRGSRD